ncbi:MAG TPA: hypothetical protein VFR87_07745 [Nocardioidaceae bacterium]|nr:hypothetical protein [Nocardioidaceae bacterium]
MTGSARVLRWTAFSLMAVFGLLGGLFVAGETFMDPGGWTAAFVTALWVLPMVGLSAFALLRPERAGPVFVGLTGLLALFTLADSAFGIIPRDDWGPVTAVAVFALGVSLAFLGLKQAGLAGVLMVVLALAQVAATALGIAIHEPERAGEGPGLGALLGGSGGVVVLPLLVVGVLFLFSSSLTGESRGRRTPRVHPAH